MDAETQHVEKNQTSLSNSKIPVNAFIQRNLRGKKEGPAVLVMVRCLRVPLSGDAKSHLMVLLKLSANVEACLDWAFCIKLAVMKNDTSVADPR